MTLLALECSSEWRSVAVSRDGRLLAEASHAAGRDTPLFTLIEQVLGAAALGREAIEGLAIGLGPGSYTGIRMAIAAAQGWELARDIRLLGVNSVDACAVRCRREGLRGRVAIVVDAQRGEFYTAEYDLTEIDTRPVFALRLASRAEIERLSIDGAQLAGPDAGLGGIPGHRVMPDAAAILELAEGRSDFVGGERLEPVYLRATSFAKGPPVRRIDV